MAGEYTGTPSLMYFSAESLSERWLDRFIIYLLKTGFHPSFQPFLQSWLHYQNLSLRTPSMPLRWSVFHHVWLFLSFQKSHIYGLFLNWKNVIFFHGVIRQTRYWLNIWKNHVHPPRIGQRPTTWLIGWSTVNNCKSEPLFFAFTYFTHPEERSKKVNIDKYLLKFMESVFGNGQALFVTVLKLTYWTVAYVTTGNGCAIQGCRFYFCRA